MTESLNELPKVTHDSKIVMAGVELSLCHLDNGQTIIPQDDMIRFLALLASGAAKLTPDDIETVNRIMGPRL